VELPAALVGGGAHRPRTPQDGAARAAFRPEPGEGPAGLGVASPRAPRAPGRAL
jgi:hypothetical protein